MSDGCQDVQPHQSQHQPANCDVHFLENFMNNFAVLNVVDPREPGPLEQIEKNDRGVQA